MFVGCWCSYQIGMNPECAANLVFIPNYLVLQPNYSAAIFFTDTVTINDGNTTDLANLTQGINDGYTTDLANLTQDINDGYTTELANLSLSVNDGNRTELSK